MAHRCISFVVSLTLLPLVAPYTCAAADQEKTPAETKIIAAEQALASDAKATAARSALAMALAERARETADPKYYEQAEAIIETWLASSPDDLEARKAHAWIKLGRHEFASALEICQQLERQFPDDPMVYGMLTDAHVELGNYAEAEKACQWLLDMRPDAVSALTRGAYLRELLGDEEGATELMLNAYDLTPPHEREYRAWILTQIGHLSLKQGKLPDAQAAADRARALFGDYHYEVALRAEIYAAQERHDDALAEFQKLVELAPHPENFFLLGLALRKAGRNAEADVEFERFEAAALRESHGWDNANRELVAYYVDVAARPEEALRIAAKEVERRRDYRTLAIHAWALHAAGDEGAARRQIDAALEVGVRDAELFYRGAAIARAQGDQNAAKTFVERAIQLNPTSPWTRLANAALSH